MNKVSSPASVKSVCAASSVRELKGESFCRAEIGGGHGQKRPAKAVADGVDLGVRDDGADRFQSLEHPQPEIIVQSQIPVMGRRVVPGDHEDRVATIDQVFDERIAGREVQNVVLHDPGRHDQHRLVMDLLGGWRVLNELNQPVAVDHLPLRDCDIFAGDKVRRGLGGFPLMPSCQSFQKFDAPRRRFWPPSRMVALSTSGLVAMKFAGETASRSCLAIKATTCSW